MEVYRLVTYIFVYEDVISLVCSAVIIWYFAGSFEKMVGTVKHSFLTLAFAVSLALLYLVLRTMASSLLKMMDAEGFTPVAFAMLAASIARSQMKRTMLFGVNFHMAFVPWLLLCIAWIIPSCSFLANLCGLLIGNIYGYGYCFALDFSESTASCLDQKFPFRLLKRIPGVKYVPGSLAERRAFQNKKLNPVPGSYPTQNYHTPLLHCLPCTCSILTHKFQHLDHHAFRIPHCIILLVLWENCASRTIPTHQQESHLLLILLVLIHGCLKRQVIWVPTKHQDF
uniref:Peptidase S54 rhomboid domain-containing protein n=1 Tax=Naja naja TaxID=35670 RepID=A0A8C6XX88_NAJNA